ncbi:MAG: GNAT family N-acetyltransferase [Acidiferrobacter sp.]
MVSASEEITLTWADQSHAKALAGLINAAYRGGEGPSGWTSEAHLLAGQRVDMSMVAEILAQPTGGILIACRGRELRGCVHLEPRPAQCCYLGLLAIRPDFQAQGLGSLLVAQAEAVACRDFGSTIMELTVIRLRRDLIAWYERRGYRLNGETRAFPYGDARFGKPRRADLAFGVMHKPLASA